MTKLALISGRLGVAVFEDGDSLYRLAPFEAPRELTPYDVSIFLEFGKDIRIATGTRESVEAQLLRSTDIESALGLLACGLDPTLSDDTRGDCLSAAEDYLKDEDTRTRVSNRLLGTKAPDRADTRGAVRLADLRRAKVCSDLFKALLALGNWPSIVHVALEAEFFAALTPVSSQSAIKNSFLDSGALAGFACGIASGSRKAIANTFVQAACDPDLRHLQGAVLILNGLRARLQGTLSDKEVSRPQLSEATAREPECKSARQQDPVLSIISQLHEGWQTRKSSKRKINALQAKEIVDKQIKGVSSAIFAGDFVRADRYLVDLIRFNAETSAREHIGMTLCSLAKVAIEANEPEYAEKLANYALALDIEDPVIYDTRAEVLRASGRLKEALAAYKEATERFPESHWGFCGYAEMFREMGLYQQSAAAYERAIASFPDSSVAFNGRAEVFRSAGDFESALSMYAKTMERFPTDPVPMSGYVEVLKDLGRYHEAVHAAEQTYISFGGLHARVGTTYAGALRAAGRLEKALEIYEKTTRRFPDSFYSRVGHAETLRRMGRFKKALAEYDQLLATYPGMLSAKIGRAQILLNKGDVQGAKAALADHTSLRSALDWRAYRTLGLIALRSGEIDQAIQMLENGYNNAPWARVRSYFATSLGFAKLKKRSYVEGLSVLGSDINIIEQPRKDIRLLFVGHLNAEKGDGREALKILDRVGQSPDPNVLQLKTELIRLYRLEEPRVRLRTSELVALRSSVDNREYMLAAAA